MPSTISSSDITNIHIYSRSSQELGLCQKHRQELCQTIADELDDLVTSQLFQTQFKSFLPASNTNEESRIRIRIARDQITIQEIDQEGRAVGRYQRIHLDNNENFEDEEIFGEAKEINKDILKKANQIYRNHSRESDRGEPPSRSTSSSHSRTTRYRPRRQRVREEKSSKRSHKRERYPSSDHEERYRHGKPLQQNKHNKGPNSISKSAPNTQLRQSPHLVKSHTESTISAHNEELQELQRKKNGQVSSENASLKARLPESKSSILSEEYNDLIYLSQTLASTQFSGALDFPADLKARFLNMPKNIRDAIYYQTYLLVDPSEAHDPWPIGQRLLENNGFFDTAPNLCRAHAVRHYLMHMLASDFAHIEGKKPPEELLRRFSQLPEEDQNAVLTQLAFIQPKGPDYRGAAHSFDGKDYLSVTNQERSIAIHRVTLDRIAEYHRHHYREMMKQLELHFKQFQEDALAVNRQ